MKTVICNLSGRILRARQACLLFLIIFLLFSACSTRAPVGERVRIGYLPIYAHLPLFVAAENGIFSEKGLEVEMVRFESSPAIGTALVNHDIDATASISYATAVGIESRDPGVFKIFAATGENADGYLSAFVTMPGSGIEKVEDLKGKTIGIFPGPGAKVFFGLVLKKHGLDPNTDVNLVELAASLQIQALVSGQVDALAAYEPTGTQAVIDYGAIKFLPAAVETEVLQPWQGGVWVVSTQFMGENNSTVERFIEAIYESIDFIRSNPSKAQGALIKYTGIDQRVAGQTPAMDTLKLHEIDIVNLQKQTDLLYEAGIISKPIEAQSLLIDAGQ